MTNPKPIRCFEGNAQPHEAFWRVRDAAQTGGDPELEFYGVISEYSWFEDDITPKKFKQDLYDLGKGGPLTVRIDSPGGDVVAASTIRAIMSDYPGEITVRVDGMAASAAVIVAMSGKTVRMMDSAYMMIHDPYLIALFAILDIETLGRLHDALGSIKKGIVDVYTAKTGLSEARVNKMMSDETWMSAAEAVNFGFATEIIEGGQQKKASNMNNMAFVNALQSYENVPSELLNLTSEEERRQADVRRESIERLRDRIQHYRKENNNG